MGKDPFCCRETFLASLVTQVTDPIARGNSLPEIGQHHGGRGGNEVAGGRGWDGRTGARGGEASLASE
jgi:hypothetical protein